MTNLIYLLTTGSLLLTAFLLFTKPRYTNRYANRWLAFFLWSLSAVFLDECFSILHLTEEIPFRPNCWVWLCWLLDLPSI